MERYIEQKRLKTIFVISIVSWEDSSRRKGGMAREKRIIEIASVDTPNT